MLHSIYTEEHHEFRELAKRFCEREILPHEEKWRSSGQVSRDVWLAAGKCGLLCTAVPQEYGGAGVEDFRFNAVLDEMIIKAGLSSSVGFFLQNDVVQPYLLHHASDEQKRSYLPGMVTGETITAIAMTEPAAGSDVANIRTNAVRQGDSFILNGSKTFITNGLLCDVVIVAAKTSPGAGAHGVSLFLVKSSDKGFRRGRKLEKIGMPGQDTAELFFDDVEVPETALLGEENCGFYYLMEKLPQERLSISVMAVATMEKALELTIEYCSQREAFGQKIAHFQHTRFELAELLTRVEVARNYLDHCLLLHVNSSLDAITAAKLKYFVTDLQQTVVRRCLQLFGGYGFMNEYPIARLYADGIPATIYGGTNEIMREIIGRNVFDSHRSDAT